ncbi:hypothetical protein F4782DRAFT_132787 [Xylaria castorea]|nr:hypothetical protein F4782DRAFT_132787 [Xylaria castorea]
MSQCVFGKLESVGIDSSITQELDINNISQLSTLLAAMSTRPTNPTDTLVTVASSASSQKTTTIESKISSDQNSRCPGSSTQPSFPRLYPRFPPVVFLPSRTSPAELPTHHQYPESTVHYNDFSRNGPSDLLPYIDGRSGRTTHIMGIVCVVVVITLILLVILILRYGHVSSHRVMRQED